MHPTHPLGSGSAMFDNKIVNIYSKHTIKTYVKALRKLCNIKKNDTS